MSFKVDPSIAQEMIFITKASTYIQPTTFFYDTEVQGTDLYKQI